MNNFLKKVFNIGLAGFGGPAILGFMKREFVDNDKLITEQEFFEGLSLSQMLPGATGVNLVSYIGYKKYNLLTAFLAFLLFAAPSVVSMFFFSFIYFNYGNISIVKEIFNNINIAVVVIFVITIEKIALPLTKKKLYIFIMTMVILLKLILNANVFILIGVSVLLTIAFEKVQILERNTQERPMFLYKPVLAFVLFITFVIFAFIIKQHQLADIFFNFSKIGFMVFGGGTASIPMIHDALVENLKWLSNKEFLTGISIAQLTPGPVLNISTFTGYKLAGFFGSLCATAGIFLPGFLLMIILSGYSDFVLSKPIFKKFSSGILAGFTGLLLYVFINFFTQAIISVRNGVMFAVLLFLQYRFKLPPLIIILITIALGLLLNYLNIK